ncbi:TPA: hypothetical protein ACIBC4_003699 [Salmonella enterica subsp. enterica serovar Potsdam]
MTTITREEVKAFIEQIESDLSNGWEAQIFELKLARIALASLTAKPIAHTSQYGIDRMIRDNAGLLVQAHGGNAYEIPLYTTPPAPIVPDAISTRQAISKMEECEPCDSINVAYKYGWNACRATMLQANQRDLSQPVDPQVTKYEQIMLQAGWVMMPVEPTEEMIAAAMECEDVLFNSDGSFCVQFREIYCAMVDAALALNKGEY